MDALKKTVAICGATGFIGGNLSQHLEQAGCKVIPIGRDLLADNVREKLVAALDSCNTVINVTGQTIDHRWSDSYKKVLYESRVDVVRRLVDAMQNCKNVRTFISASAVGYYPSDGCYNESSTASGDDFLAELCRAWEAEAHKAPDGIRTIITRFGVVLAQKGGAFGRMSHPAKVGIAAVAGNGRQHFTWIDIEDLCRAMLFLIDSRLVGTFNLVAPQQLTQGEATAVIAKDYKSLFTVKIPAMFFRMLRGEAADFMLKGQCVSPKRLLDAGFEFKSPGLQDFLNNIEK